MKKTIFIFVFLLNWIGLSSQNILTGHVTDHATGKPLSDVTLFFNDLLKGAVSNEAGYYGFADLPQGTFILEVKHLGYRSWISKVILKGKDTLDIALEQTAAEMREVIITGSSSSVERRLNPVPSIVLSADDLHKSSSSNLVDALSSLPGISQITTGQGISKPVIRGLGYNRVIVLQDGIRQEEQQWGDEHGVELDADAVQRVEVIKGPGSIMYGSDAMAGVINFLSSYPLETGTLFTQLSSEFQTNNKMGGFSVLNRGRKGGLNWQAAFGSKFAGNYRNKADGFVHNSALHDQMASGIIGLNKKWGNTQFSVSYFNQEIGIPEGERDSLGRFVTPVISSDSISGYTFVGQEELKSYQIGLPYQHLSHFRVTSSNNILLGKCRLAVKAGYQLNDRKEYAEIFSPTEISLAMKLSTGSFDMKWFFPEWKGWETTIGASGMIQQNIDGGKELLIPDYHYRDIGLFGFVRKQKDAFLFSGGLRIDHRWLTSNAMLNPEGELQFNGFERSFRSFSASAGMSYSFSDHLVGRFNLSKGFRAPNIAELSANGVHEGTYRYELGRNSLIPENSKQVDLGLSYNSMHVAIEADLFFNSIDHYIFLEKLSSRNGGDSLANEEGYPVYQYMQGRAHLYGGEFTLDLHPHPYDWIHFETTLGYTRGIQPDQPDSLSNLPLIPPMKVQSHIRIDVPENVAVITGLFMKLGTLISFRQDKYYAAYGTETATPAWWVLNATIGTDFCSKKGAKLMSVYLIGNNLLDVNYQDHLSRLKYAPENPLTGKKGIFNMGRNFTVKLIMPINNKFKT